MARSDTPGYKARGNPTSGQAGLAVTYSSGLFTPSASFNATGILVKTQGVITGKLHGDSADLAYPVVPGFYPLGFKSITEAGTTNTGAGELVLVRGS